MEPPYDPANLNARAAAMYDYEPRPPHPPLFVDRPDFYPQHHRHPPFPHPPPPPPPPPQRHHHHHRPSDDPRLYLPHLPPPLPSYRILLPRDPLPHASWDRGRPDPERLRDAAENFRALDRRPSPPPLAWEQGESGAGFLGRKRPRWGEDWILAEEEEKQDMRSQRRIEFPESVGCRRDPYFDPSPQLDTAPLAPPSRSSRHVSVVPGRAREAFRAPPQSYWSSSHLRSDIQVADGKMAFDFDGTIQREINHGYQEDRHNKGKRKVLSDGWYAENSQQNLRSPWKSNALNRKQSGVSVWDRIEEKPPPPVWNRIEEKRLPPSPPHGFSPSHGFSEQQPEMDRLDLSYKPTGLVAKVMVPPSPMGLSVEVKPTSLDANATKKKVVKKKVAKKSDMVAAPLVLGLSGSGAKGVTKKPVSSNTPKVPNQLEEKGEVMATSAKPVDDASPHLCLKKMTTMSSSGKNPAKRVAKSIGSVEAGSSEGAKEEGNKILTAKKQLRKCASTKASEIKNKDDNSSQLCQQELTVVRSSTKMGGTEQSSGNVDPVEQGRIEGIEEGECVRLDANTARNCANSLVSDLGNVNDSSPPTTRMGASKQANGAANPVEQGSIAGIVEEECVPVDVHAGQNCACSSVSVIGIMNDSSLCTTKMGAPEQSNESVNPVECGIKGIEEGECMEPNVNAGQNCAEFFISDIGIANNSNLHLSTQGVTEIRATLESDTNEGLNETITSIENLMAVNPSEEVKVAMEDVEQPVHSDIGFAASIPKRSDQVKKVISSAASLTLTIESDSLKGVDEERERSREEKEQQLEIDADMEEIQTPDGGRNKSGDACLHSQVEDMPAPLPLEVKDIVSYVSPPIGFVDGEVTCFSVPVNGGPLKADTLKLVEDSPVVSVFDSLVERIRHPSPFELSKIDSSAVASVSRDAMDCMDTEHSLGQLSDGKGCIDSNNSDNDEKEINNVDSLLICDKPLVSKSEQYINVGKVMLEDQPNSQRTLASYGSKKQKAPNLEAAGEGVTSRKTIMSAGDLRVLPNRSNLLGSSKETTRLGFNSRHRTWQRNNSTSSLTPSHGNLHSQGLLHKMSFKKSKLPTTSYIRKGNSLIRKSATEVPFPHHSQGPAASSRVDKAATMSTKDLESSKVINSDQMNCSNPYFERPTTPPLPFSNKLLNSITRPAEDESHQMVEDPIFEAGIEARVGTPESQTLDLVSSGVNNQSISGGRKTEPLNTSKMIYVRHKSNQLVAARGPVSAHSSVHPVQKAQTLSSNALRDLYHRRKKNQLIRNTLSSEGQSKHVIIPVDNSNSDDQRMYNISSLKHGTTGQFKKRLDKVIQRTHKHSKFSLVWTLRGEESHRKGVSSLNHWNVLPSLFPWKRTLYQKNSASVSNRRSSLISQNLQLTKKRNMIYTVSTDGFSLRKAGVLGIGGSSLKWSKSIERRSKKANEEATLAVAEEERKKRERKRRTLFVDGGENGNCLSRKSDFGIELQQGERVFRVGSARYKMDASRRTLIRISDVHSTLAVDQQSENNFQNSFVPSRLLIGNDEYIQVGNGNQLVRDPKKLKRILASEKVRWSLHTVRLRLARKQQYCQFFTRFGWCNKNGGKCPYIHDPTKVAICTKFLRGVCSNTDCKLTHKILPERMPDCSYFLRGLCTNVSCPYRHVNVNSKASVCEGFLRGYCAEGDECHKKHSYVCPIFEASGKCPQGSTCKLHHPKSRSATKKRKRRKVEHNSKGRYFGSSIMETGKPLPVASTYPDMEKGGDIFYCEGRFTDYFSLDVSSDDDIVQNNATVDSRPTQWDLDLSDMQPDDLDALIKPVRIMNKANLTSD